MAPDSKPTNPQNALQTWDYDAVLFDLDGVITPTARVHRRAWKETFEKVLPEVAHGDQTEYRDDDYVTHIDGKPRFEGVRDLLEAHDVDLPEGSHDDPPGTSTVGAVGNMKNERFNTILDNEPIEPYPGTIALIDRLKGSGVSMAVVSSSSNAKKVLAAAGLENVFEVVVDGLVVKEAGLKGKPSADPFLEAARRLDVPPSRSVVVEDALAGVEAGRDGDFGLVVGVARVTDPDKLREAGADLVVSDLGELL